MSSPEATLNGAPDSTTGAQKAGPVTLNRTPPWQQRKRRGGGFLRRRVCRFCADSKLAIDYKDPRNLRFCISETGKMVPSRISGNCARHQRQVTRAIKRARHLALMPFIEVGG